MWILMGVSRGGSVKGQWGCLRLMQLNTSIYGAVVQGYCTDYRYWRS